MQIMGLFSILGSAFGANKAWQGIWAAKDWYDAKKNHEMREDTAIQRRVADAKAAGVHPLYALGGSGSPSQQFRPGGAGEKILTRVTSDNIEADTALKMARAAEIRKGLQDANSSQDKEEIERFQPGVVVDKTGGLESAAKGKYIINPVTGQRVRIGSGTSKEFLESEYDEVTAFIYSAMKSLVDHNFFDGKKKGKAIQIMNQLMKKQHGRNKTWLNREVKSFYQKHIQPIWKPYDPQKLNRKFKYPIGGK
jgi:hypothetical protein